MRINEKFELMKKILTKDIVRNHLISLKEAGAFGRLSMNKRSLQAIRYHLPIMLYLDLFHRNSNEIEIIAGSAKTLCERVAMPIVKELFDEFQNKSI